MQPSSAEDYYTDMHGYARNGDENSVDFQGYVDDTIPIARGDALFSPATGVEVPDRVAVFNHPRLYVPPAVPSLLPLPMTGHLLPAPITYPDCPVQLDPDTLLPVNQDPPALQMQQMTMAPGLFIGPMSFEDALLSPIPEGDQLLTNLVVPEYPHVNASAHTPVSPTSTSLSTAASILPYPFADLIIANNETSDHGAQGTSSSETATAASLPIVKLPLGVWKCIICGAKLRRKQRAVVHFWNKHGSMRVECQGRCGVPECYKSFTSQDGLDVHLNPVLVDCSSCGRSLLKKNIIRHKEQHCPLREPVS